MLNLPGSPLSGRHLAALPFALRRKLLLGYLSRHAADPDSLAADAAAHVPFYRALCAAPEWQETGPLSPRGRGRDERREEPPPEWQETSPLSPRGRGRDERREERVRGPAPAQPLPTRLSSFPVWAPEAAKNQPLHAFLAQPSRSRGGHAFRPKGGPWGLLETSDLLAFAATALLHPQAATLGEELSRNPLAVQALPHTLSIAAPALERLLRAMAGTPVAVAGLPDPVIARVLAQVTPSVVAARSAPLLRWLKLLRTSAPGDFDRVRESLKILLAVEASAPLAHARRVRLEQELELRVVDLFTDDYSFALLSCPCGEVHANPLLHLETADARLRPTDGPGRLVVTDLSRKAAPVVRHATRFLVTLAPAACPHAGRTTTVTCTGRVDEEPMPKGFPSRREIEEQIHHLTLPVDFTLDRSSGKPILRLEPFADRVDLPALEKALSTRFNLKIPVTTT